MRAALFRVEAAGSLMVRVQLSVLQVVVSSASAACVHGMQGDTLHAVLPRQDRTELHADIGTAQSALAECLDEVFLFLHCVD